MQKSDDAQAMEVVANYLAKRGDDSALHGLGAVREVEHRLAEFFGATYAVCMSSATAGLEAIGRALDFPPTAEFVTTDFTWGGALAPWLHRRMQPRFGAVDDETLTLDPASARDLITRRTKLLLVPDYLGYPADTRGFREIADAFGLWYIADAAYGFGSRNGVPAGSRADAIVVSFSHGKPLWAGDGGAVITSNRSLYEQLLWWTQHPARQIRELGPSLRNEFSFNSRMHPLAAIWLAETLTAQLENLRGLQREFARAASLLNASGLTDPICLLERGIQPVGTHLVARRRRTVLQGDVDELLRQHAIAEGTMPLPTNRVTGQPAFRAQFAAFAARRTPCQRLDLRRRFYVRLCATREAQRSLPFAPLMHARGGA